MTISRKSCVLVFRFLLVSVASIAGEAQPIIWPVSASCWPYTALKPLCTLRSMSMLRLVPSLPSMGSRLVMKAWCFTG